MSECVVERPGGAGEEELAGAAAQRLIHGELTVRHVLTHGMAQELDARGSQPFGRRLIQRVEVADHRVRRHAEADEEPGAAVGRQEDVGPGGEGAVPDGVAVLAVEEDDGERATPSSGPRVRHPADLRSLGKAAS